MGAKIKPPDHRKYEEFVTSYDQMVAVWFSGSSFHDDAMFDDACKDCLSDPETHLVFDPLASYIVVNGEY
jgi:hypothetical protein